MDGGGRTASGTAVERATQEAKAEERERETAWFPWSTVGIHTSDFPLALYAFPRRSVGTRGQVRDTP